MSRYLILEDGTRLEGTPYGAASNAYGEIVFTTSMTGYIESLTDPSYRGQMIVFASPTIGNYPISSSKMESGRVQASAIITKDAHSTLFAGKVGEDFDRFLKENNIPGIDGIDTRLLVRKIREFGTMKASISDDPEIPSEWLDPMDRNLVSEVSCREPYTVEGRKGTKILFIDVGAKRSLVERVREVGSLYVVPYDFDFASIGENFDAVFISNGPGDPSHSSLDRVVNFAREASSSKPVFGVCLGHQIISLAFGAKTKKMRFGHRGSNHAVTDNERIWITSHNHGYTVDSESLKGTGLVAKQWDVNDGEVEMVEHSELPVFSVQYHPEASPGPQDSAWFFERMSRTVDEYNAKKQ